jgi:hypothetical protein
MALVALPVGLGVVPTLLGDGGGAALGASHPLRPPHRPDGLEAFGVVDEGLDVEDHRRGIPGVLRARSLESVLGSDLTPEVMALELPPRNPG